MRLERHEGYWLLVGPAAPGASATTLGPLILMRPHGVGDARLLRHELEHVRQWRRYGVIGFLRRYLGAYVGWRVWGYGHKAAYRRIPFEIEAEWRARRAPIEGGMSEAEPEAVGMTGELATRSESGSPRPTHRPGWRPSG